MTWVALPPAPCHPRLLVLVHGHLVKFNDNMVVTVGSLHLEVNPEPRATRVSRAGTGIPITMHLHQEGKPLKEVLQEQELLQELLLITHERTYAQVVVSHRPPRSENFELLTPFLVRRCRESIVIFLLVDTRTQECSLP